MYAIVRYHESSCASGGGFRGAPRYHGLLGKKTLEIFFVALLLFVEGFVFGVARGSFFVSWFGIVFGR